MLCIHNHSELNWGTWSTPCGAGTEGVSGHHFQEGVILILLWWHQTQKPVPGLALGRSHRGSDVLTAAAPEARAAPRDRACTPTETPALPVLCGAAGSSAAGAVLAVLRARCRAGGCERWPRGGGPAAGAPRACALQHARPLPRGSTAGAAGPGRGGVPGTELVAPGSPRVPPLGRGVLEAGGTTARLVRRCWKTHMRDEACWGIQNHLASTLSPSGTGQIPSDPLPANKPPSF